MTISCSQTYLADGLIDKIFFPRTVPISIYIYLLTLFATILDLRSADRMCGSMKTYSDPQLLYATSYFLTHLFILHISCGLCYQRVPGINPTRVIRRTAADKVHDNRKA
jgi:hypothetical protein